MGSANNIGKTTQGRVGYRVFPKKKKAPKFLAKQRLGIFVTGRSVQTKKIAE